MASKVNKSEFFYLGITCFPFFLVSFQILIYNFLEYGTEHSGKCIIHDRVFIEEKKYAYVQLCLDNLFDRCSIVEICNLFSEAQILSCLDNNYQINTTVDCWWYDRSVNNIYLQPISHYYLYSSIAGVSGGLFFLFIIISAILYMIERRNNNFTDYGTIEIGRDSDPAFVAI